MPAVASLNRPVYWLQVCLASIAAVLLSACGALPASAATILLLNPSSIRAGFQIEIRATCGDNTNPAFVHSSAFGSVTLVPSHGLLSENVTIPASTRSGTYNVSLECASGQQSSAKLTVIDGGHGPNPHNGPHTGGGQMAASTGGRLALLGGLGALVAGVGIWLLSAIRRRSPVV